MTTQQEETAGTIGNNGNNNNDNNNLIKVQTLLSNMKQISNELSTKLQSAIQSNKERGMRQPKLKSTAIGHGMDRGGPNNNEIGGGGGAPAATVGVGGGGKCGKHASKTLSSLNNILLGRQSSLSLEMNDNNLSNDDDNKIQFLQPSTTTSSSISSSMATTANDNNGGGGDESFSGANISSSKDWDNRITFDGNIIDRINAVDPSAVEDMKSRTTSSNNNMISSEAMNGMYIPTMAPSMFSQRSAYNNGGKNEGGGLDIELENKLKKKKKTKSSSSKKRKLGSTSKDDGADDDILSGGGTSKKRRSKGKKKYGGEQYDNNNDNLGGLKPPPPSPSRIVGTGHVRTLPDLTPTQHPKLYTITTDDNPNRVCNPLLRLPQFPDGPRHTLPITDIPQGAELWNISDLHYYSGDTYPISYLGRLLGFDISNDAAAATTNNNKEEEEFGRKFDVNLIGRNMKGDTIAEVPDRGTFGDRVWRNGGTQQHKNTMSSGSGSGGASSVQTTTTGGYGMTDDLNLTYSDPLWANILSSYKGYNEDDFKDAGKGFVGDISQLCIEYARERGMILQGKKKNILQSEADLKEEEKGAYSRESDSMRFRVGTEKDEEILSLLADKVRSTFQYIYIEIHAPLEPFLIFCAISSSSLSANGNLNQSMIWLLAFVVKVTFASSPSYRLHRQLRIVLLPMLALQQPKPQNIIKLHFYNTDSAGMV